MKNIGHNSLFYIILFFSLLIPITTIAMQLVETIKNNSGIIDGLDNPIDIEASPDSNHVYVISESSSENDNSFLVVFNHNPYTNNLTFIESYNSSNIAGLNGAKSVTVSPDGKYIYVASTTGYLVVFERNFSNGTAKLFEKYEISNASSVVASADNKHVYVANDNSIFIFIRDNEGKLSQNNEINGIAGTLTISPNDKYIYVLDYDDDSLIVFSRNSSTGELTFIESHKNAENNIDGLANPKSLVVDPNNEYIYVHGEIDNGIISKTAIAIFKHDNDNLTFVDKLSASSITIGLNKIDSIGITDDYLYIANNKRLFIFSYNAGILTKEDEQGDDADNIDFFEAITVTPDGKSIIGIDKGQNAISTFKIDPVTSVPSFIKTLKNGTTVITGLVNANLTAVSPDGKHLYITGNIDNNIGALSLFYRDESSEKLILIDTQTDIKLTTEAKLGSINSIAISNDGKYVYVTSKNSNALVVFERNNVTGVLRFIESKELTDISSVLVSHDSEYVYVTYGNTITLFRNDNGKLTYINNYDAEVGSPYSLMISPNGRYLYVIDMNNITSLAMFNREITTSELNFIESYEYTEENGIGVANAIEVSQDNKYVYVVSGMLRTIALFEHDSSTGKLTFIEKLVDEDNTKGLNNANSIVLSIDGNYIYVVSGNSTNGTLSLFNRDPETGRITFNTKINDIDGLKGANSIAITSDNLYIASEADNAINVFTTVQNQPPEITFSESPYSTDENVPLIFSNKISITDADAFNNPIKVILTSSNGTLNVNNICEITSEKITCAATLTEINTILNDMTFDPSNEDAIITITVNDQGNTGGGGEKIAQEIITVKVNSVTVNTTKPILGYINDKVVTVGEKTTLTADVTNNKQLDDLRFDIIGHDGAYIDANGLFNWTPTESGTEKFTVFATEISTELTSNFISFTVIVTTPPEIKPIEEKNIFWGEDIELNIEASHREKYPLEFDLIKHPNGASINGLNGNLNWIPESIWKPNSLCFDGIKACADFTVIVKEKKYGKEKTISFKVRVNKPETKLQFSLNSNSIYKDNTINVNGILSSYPKQNLSNLNVELEITSPTGNTITKTTTTNTIDGKFIFESLKEFSQVGTYKFQTAFAGNNKFMSPEYSPIETLQVMDVAGYAILIGGKHNDDMKSLKTHNKSLNRAYNGFKSRGFKDEDIAYLKFDDNQVKTGIDDYGTPSITSISSAFIDIQGKMEKTPGPLYVVMVGHSDTDGNFYLNDDTISPIDINNWLKGLETVVKNNNYPRIIVVGACYSGNYISVLSALGRVIVTSSTNKEESYRGPREPDQIRSGDYFFEAFFSTFEQGKSLLDSFNIATEDVENYTQLGPDAPFNFHFQDSAAQHPLLDDNGDKEGNNIVPIKVDGKEEGYNSKHIYLGVGSRLNPEDKNAPVMITTVTPTKYLQPNASTIELFATVNKPERVAGNQIIAYVSHHVVRQPDGEEHKGQLEIVDDNFQQIILKPSNGKFTNVFSVTDKKAGKYDVFYFVKDEETEEISPIKKHSVFFKNKQNNSLPSTFKLIEPENGTETQTTVIFKWGKSFEPDKNQKITYTFSIATEPSFNTIVYQQEGLIFTETYIDSKTIINGKAEQYFGLKDDQKYYWKVIAIDNFGGKTVSPTFSFKTNNKNYPPSIIDEIWCTDFDCDDDAWEHILEYLENTIHSEDGIFSEEEINSGEAHKMRRRKPNNNSLSKIQFAVGNTKPVKRNGKVEFLVMRTDGKNEEISVSYSIIAKNYKNGFLVWQDQDDSLKKISVDLNEYNETINIVLIKGNGYLLGDPSQLRIEYVEQETTDLVTSSDGSNTPSTETLTKNNGTNTSSTETGETGSSSTTDTDDSINVKEETDNIYISNTTDIPLVGDNIGNPTTVYFNTVSPVVYYGELQFSQNLYKADEDQKEVTISVERKEGMTGAVSVKYIAHTPFENIEGKLEWKEGNTDLKYFSLTIKDNELVAGNNLIKLQLHSPKGRARIGIRGEAILQIIDDDIPPAKFEISNNQVTINLSDSIDDKKVIIKNSFDEIIYDSNQYPSIAEEDERVIVKLQRDYGKKDLIFEDFFGFNVFEVKGSVDLPDLGYGVMFDSYKNIYEKTDDLLKGGISVNNNRYYQVNQTVYFSKYPDIQSDSIRIMGEILVNEENIGKKADIFLAISYMPLGVEDIQETFYIRNNGKVFIPSLYIEQLDNLRPFIKDVTLQKAHPIELYKGEVPGTGKVKVFLGYRLKDSNKIIYNDNQPINLTIKEHEKNTD